MDINDLRLYSVKVEGGSGVLFQPMNKLNYTYVLTAKHNMFGERQNAEDGRIKEKYQLDKVNIYIQKHYETNPIVLSMIIGENYFPHETADIAILKIDYIEGYQNIFVDENSEKTKGANICGYPGYIRTEKPFTEQYTSFEIKNFIGQNVNTCRAQLTDENKAQTEIKGFSGGGILKIENKYLFLIGIQSEVSSHIANGQIEYVPVKFFNEIIANPDFNGKLTSLLPPFMGGFEYMKDKAFNIDAGIDDDDISFTRAYLRSKADEVTKSDITPVYIKDFFRERLLLNESDHTKLNNELIYLTWLEFISIINIAKDKNYNCADLEGVFNVLRLIYRDTDNSWQDSEFLSECLESDYPNLKTGGTVLIKTNKLPARADIRHYRIDRGSIVSRIDHLRTEFEVGNIGDIFINNASGELKEFAFDKYNFIHFEYIKEFLLVANCKDYASFKRANIDELKEKLKNEYGKLFSI